MRVEDQEGDAEVVVDGTRHHGEWEVAAGMIYVRWNGRLSTPTHVGALDPDWLAKDVLRGMIRDDTSRT